MEIRAPANEKPCAAPGVSAVTSHVGDDGEFDHLELVWDPTESAPLGKSVNLPKGTWQVSLMSVPIPFEREPYSNAAWSVLTGAFKGTELAGLCAYQRIKERPDSFPSSTYDAACLRVPGWRLIPIRVGDGGGKQDAGTLIDHFGSEGETQTPIGSVPRSLGSEAERLSSDALQAVADVAVVRAQQAAFDAAQRVVVERVCGKADESDGSSLVAVLGSRLRATTGERFTLFRQTCEVLRSTSAATLPSLGASLRTAVSNDATDLLTSFLGRHIERCLGSDNNRACINLRRDAAFSPLAPGLVILTGVVAASVFDSDAVIPRAQTFVTRLAKAHDNNQALKTTMAVLAYCHQSGSCDSHSVRTYLEKPERIMDGQKAICLEAKCAAMTADAVAVVAHGLAVMRPKKGDDPKTVVLNGIRFAKGVTRLVGRSETCVDDCKKTAAQIDEILDLLFAAAEKDPARLVALAVVGLARFAGVKDLAASTKALMSLTAYAESYNAAASLTPEQARQKRAEALSALADIAKERELRTGEVAIAAGAWVGFRGGIQTFSNAPGEARQANPFVQFTIPVGITFDLGLAPSTGLWWAVAIADAGGYSAISLDGSTPVPPSVAAAFQPGFALGWTLWDFAVIGDFRFHPWQTGSTPTPSWSLGISLTYLMPLFWLR